jgi:hypothetical protein
MADNDPPQEQNWRIKPTATQTNHKIGQNHNRCSSLDLTTQTINNRRSCQILTARILRTLKSGCRTGTPQKKQVITSSDTGVDIRFASTSITNPHCKGQIILRPDTSNLKKLSTHTEQVKSTTNTIEPCTAMTCDNIN